MFILQALLCGVHGGFRSSGQARLFANEIAGSRKPAQALGTPTLSGRPPPSGPRSTDAEWRCHAHLPGAKLFGASVLVVKSPAQIILNVQLRRPGVRIENHQVLRAGIGGGNLPGDLLRRPVNGLIGHFLGESVSIMRNDILLRKRRARHAVVKLHQEYFLPGSGEIALGIRESHQDVRQCGHLLARHQGRFRRAIIFLDF